MLSHMGVFMTMDAIKLTIELYNKSSNSQNIHVCLCYTNIEIPKLNRSQILSIL